MSFKGSTIAETLVMMIVAGVIFIAIMDGWIIFGRLQIEKIESITQNSKLYESYHRIESLIALADSVSSESQGDISIYTSGRLSKFYLEDSTLLFARDELYDTLLSHVAKLELLTFEYSAPDSVLIKVIYNATPLEMRFSIKESAYKSYQQTISEIENRYDYKEDK